jgi:hypothetical protein
MRTRHGPAGQDVPALTEMLQDLTWNMPPGSKRRLKDHLVTEIRRAEPTRSAAPTGWRGWRVTSPGRQLRRRAWLLLGAGAAIAGMAAAVTAIIITSLGGLPPASPGAVRLLARVAAAAARQPTPQVGDNQYMFAEIKEVSRSLPANLEPFIRKGSLPRDIRLRLKQRRPQRITLQIWMPVSDVCRMGVERSVGSKGPGINWKFTARGSGVKCPSIGGLNDASYRLLQALPTDPHALLAMIYKVERGHGPSPDQEAFVTIGDLLRDKIAPPKVAAALYRAAALIPGVTLVHNATDAIGRHGVAVAQTADGIRTELIFSKTSLRLIGERTILAKIGISTDATAIIRQAFVDHLGQVPPAPQDPASRGAAGPALGGR